MLKSPELHSRGSLTSNLLQTHSRTVNIYKCLGGKGLVSKMKWYVASLICIQLRLSKIKIKTPIQKAQQNLRRLSKVPLPADALAQASVLPAGRWAPLGTTVAGLMATVAAEYCYMFVLIPASDNVH